jgi:hypothetical protein
MVKNITTIIFNSLEAESTLNQDNNVSFYTINTPPIEIKKEAILKVSNFCHIGQALNHTDNMYLFRVRGINVNNSKSFSGNNGGYPCILTTTFNNNRSVYDENIITLTKQTINSIDMLIDTYLISPSNGTFSKIDIVYGGINYLVGNVLTLAGAGGGSFTFRVASVSSGAIRSLTFIDTPVTTYTGIPTISSIMNGSGATFTTVAPGTAGALTSCTLSSGGLGYRVGQVINITATGATGASCTVTAVNASTGAITTISSLTSGGTGYITTNARTVTVDASAFTHTAYLIPTMVFPKIVENSIPNNIIFSMTFTIEQDEY